MLCCAVLSVTQRCSTAVAAVGVRLHNSMLLLLLFLLPQLHTQTQGVDITHEMLIYSCAGLTAPEPPKSGNGKSAGQSWHSHHHRSLKDLMPSSAGTEIASGGCEGWWLSKHRHLAAVAAAAATVPVTQHEHVNPVC